ncbi:MAG: P22 phage major capsid protein family protein, partial [Phycisphaerales bacterium]|nr:P22 phage major capsid protein family protein [Phycisphaerales bacterium]
MPNTQEYTDWLTMESLDLLTNSMEISEAFNTDYNKEFTKEFAVGDTVRIPFPWRPLIRSGLGYAAGNIERIHTTVTVNQIFGVDFEWDSAEEALKLTRGREKIQKEILGPAMSQMKQEIESRCALWAYQNTNNIVGVLGTNPTTLTPSAQARQRMVELAGTKGKKRLIIPPAVNTGLVPAFATYMQPADAIAKQYKEGIIGRAQNFDWSESMSLYQHTAGTWAGAVTVNGANQSGSALIRTCTTGDTFNQGDVISIAGRYAVNPATR